MHQGTFSRWAGLTKPSRDLEKTLCHMERHALISKKVLFQIEILISHPLTNLELSEKCVVV
jgi:hypothetical protein